MRVARRRQVELGIARSPCPTAGYGLEPMDTPPKNRQAPRRVSSMQPRCSYPASKSPTARRCGGGAVAWLLVALCVLLAVSRFGITICRGSGCCTASLPTERRLDATLRFEQSLVAAAAEDGLGPAAPAPCSCCNGAESPAEGAARQPSLRAACLPDCCANLHNDLEPAPPPGGPVLPQTAARAVAPDHVGVPPARAARDRFPPANGPPRTDPRTARLASTILRQ